MLQADEGSAVLQSARNARNTPAGKIQRHSRNRETRGAIEFRAADRRPSDHIDHRVRARQPSIQFPEPPATAAGSRWKDLTDQEDLHLPGIASASARR